MIDFVIPLSVIPPPKYFEVGVRMIFYNSTNISRKTQALSRASLSYLCYNLITNMFTIDLSSKRARLAIRFFTYGVMTLATILLTTLAVFYAMGWRFNQNDLSFEQGGLLQFISTPRGAQVVINDKLQSFTTPGRINFGAGTHTAKMQLKGYHTWQKSFSLAPGELLWLNYVRLIPQNITTVKMTEFGSVAGALASPDRRWMIVQEKAEQAHFKLVDFSDPKKPVVTELVIPDTQLTKKDDKYGQFTIKEWDLNSRYILVEHNNNGTREFVRVDRQKAADAKNISRLFSLNIAEAHFAGGNANLLFANTDGVLRSLDIGANTASAALILGVEQFTVYGNDTIAFVATRDGGSQAENKQRVAGIYTQGKETIARTFAADARVTIAYSEYTRHAYLAIHVDDDVTILRDPTLTTKDNAEVASFTFDREVKWLKFSSSGRMLVASNGNNIANYDLELDDLSMRTISGPALAHPPQWLDDYYLWTDAGDKLRLFEFDGVNDHEITDVATGLTVSLSQDGAYLYSFKKSDAGFILQSSQLVLDN